jgi:disulfide bond formation protein DsbB
VRGFAIGGTVVLMLFLVIAGAVYFNEDYNFATEVAAAPPPADDTPPGTPAPTRPPDAPGPDPAAVAAGQQLFITCAACHGPDAQGIDGLGKTLVGSEFVNGLSDSGMVDFIKVGRDPSDPLNTTGVAMLPKGGNPDLTDDDLFDIVAYIRSLN